MNETDFDTIYNRLLELQQAPDCFNPDIKEIASELGFDLTPELVIHFSIFWKLIRAVRP